MAKKEKVKQEEVKKVSAQVEGIAPRLIQKYKDEVIKSLMTEFKYKNIMQVPKLEKIAINIGVGRATQDQKLLETAVSEIELITGQKALITKSKNRFRILSCVRINQLVQKLLYAGKKCLNFSIDLFRLQCRRLETSEEFQIVRLTEMEITHSELKNKLFSEKLMQIKLQILQEWM